MMLLLSLTLLCEFQLVVFPHAFFCRKLVLGEEVRLDIEKSSAEGIVDKRR